MTLSDISIHRPLFSRFRSVPILPLLFRKMADELKKLLSTAKGKVTGLLRRFKTAIEHGDASAAELKAKLEGECDNLCVLREQLRAYEGEEPPDIGSYTQAVDEVMGQFYGAGRGRWFEKINRSVEKVEGATTRLESILALPSHEVDERKRVEMEEVKSFLLVSMNTLSVGFEEADKTWEVGELKGRVMAALKAADGVVLEVSIRLKLVLSQSIPERKPEALVFHGSAVAPDNLLSAAEGDAASSGSVEDTNARARQSVLAVGAETIIHTKKPSLPLFSGERQDWPEFKAVWRPLAEGQFGSRMQLALELKRCCKGRAADRLKHIYIQDESAYDALWDRLRSEYDDPGLSSQDAISRLLSLRPVEEQDYRGLVDLIDSVEGVHNQLLQLGQLHAVHAVDLDRLCENLPLSTRMEWLRCYRDFSAADKAAPLGRFYAFLMRERVAVARIADSTPRRHRPRDGKPKSEKAGTHVGQGSDTSLGGVSCVLHGKGHSTESCPDFAELSVKQRWEEARSRRWCFRCLRAHPWWKEKCSTPTCACGQGQAHHALLCRSDNTGPGDRDRATPKVTVNAGHAQGGALALYPICTARVSGFKNSTPINVFMDSGSNASYVSSSAVRKFKLKAVDRVSLNVTTVGGDDKVYASHVREVPLRTADGDRVMVRAYELQKITEAVALLNEAEVSKIFPQFEAKELRRDLKHVDLLVGTDYYALHPKEELASVHNLSVMRGALGVCLVGTHPLLTETTRMDSDVPKTVHLAEHKVVSCHAALRREHPAFSLAENFITGEELGTECKPKCGGCKCGKCPLPGHTLSFREEQELLMIRSGLIHDEENSCWVTSYPWVKDPLTLPDNYTSALGTLKSTERSLLRDPVWATTYCEQMDDLIQRKVVRKLKQAELNQWDGPFFYISHLAVSNPKSKSTPVRIVFNSAQVFQGISLNSYLAKGPDSYRNTLLGILLRWREEAVPLVGDIRKMFHSVYLRPPEQHCHRFLWRGLDTSREPEVYIFLRVTMGDKPAPAIATEALFMTAEKCQESHPRACQMILESSYVDDLIDSVDSESGARILAKDTEEVLEKGGFSVKCWQSLDSLGDLRGGELKESARGRVGVLGVCWDPVEDTINFEVTLNFSEKKHGERTGPNLNREGLPGSLPMILTKRMVLQQVMGIYDPMGLVSPFTLLAKIYLRETWRMKLDWDEALPPSLYNKWALFFQQLFSLEDLRYPRELKPKSAVGNPWLIILSDGSEQAYGCTAYCRWLCSDGTFSVRLIMSKSRIAPVDKVSIPRMELNGAVLSKRCRMVITKEMRYQFERVIQLVDSETVLNMLHKTSYRFHVYEGVRIGEIQAATQGDMSEWAWMPGADNVADWLTRGRNPEDLSADSDWFQGPPMFQLPFEEWDVKFGKTSDGVLPGEKQHVQSHMAGLATMQSLICYENVGSLKRAVRVVARIQGVLRDKSFKGGHIDRLSPESLREAEIRLLLEAQSVVDVGDAQYKALNPAKNEHNLWIVGANRLAQANPLGVRADLPVFLPKEHPLAALAMKESHEKGHRGRDATLALFRNRFWTPAGTALAKKIVSQCQLCRLRNGKHMEQVMGALPLERAKPSPPFNNTMVDLFGPYSIRGEVQKRISGKAWGMLFTDLASRAVHIEALFGYDADQAMMALTRFACLRGWPEKMYSDPGPQLLGAHKELVKSARRLGIDHGLQWVFGPADSPWHQGAVEALVKTAKRAIRLAINNQRLSASEFSTICCEVTNTINERPLGLLPSLDSDINVLTPNCLLMGRATASNPGGWLPEGTPLKSRVHVVETIGLQFWEHWLNLFAPSLVYQQKWFRQQPDLKVGEVVLVPDSNSLRGDYQLARVVEVHPGLDGRVRRVTLAYKNFKVGEAVKEYRGAKDRRIVRAVQRLVRLVEMDD